MISTIATRATAPGQSAKISVALAFAALVTTICTTAPTQAQTPVPPPGASAWIRADHCTPDGSRCTNLTGAAPDVLAPPHAQYRAQWVATRRELAGRPALLFNSPAEMTTDNWGAQPFAPAYTVSGVVEILPDMPYLHFAWSVTDYYKRNGVAHSAQIALYNQGLLFCQSWDQLSSAQVQDCISTPPLRLGRVVYTLRATANRQELWIDGQLVAAQDVPTVPIPLVMHTNAQVLAENMIYGRALTDAEIGQLRLYFDSRYNPAVTNTSAEIYDEIFVAPLAGWMTVTPGATADETTSLLQAKLDQLAQNALPMPNDLSGSPVLYLGPGTYQINRSLELTPPERLHAEGEEPFHQLFATIIGQDPANTVIEWVGPGSSSSEPLSMLTVNGLAVKVSRLSFEGHGVAQVGLDRPGWARIGRTSATFAKIFSTYSELSDLWFNNLQVGIRLGSQNHAGQAEQMIRRGRFTNCAHAGIRTEAYNSLDVWVWDSLFRDGNYGVFNEFGNFKLFNNVFERSKVADFGSKNLQNFTVIGNTSIDSGLFTHWGGITDWNSAPAGSYQAGSARVLIQGNAVYDTAWPQAVITSNSGPFLFVDNLFRNRPGVSDPAMDLGATRNILVGNTFSASPSWTSTPQGWLPPARVRSIDERVRKRDLLPLPNRLLPPTPRHQSPALVQELTAANAAELQTVLQNAPSGAVIHLQKGVYDVGPLIIPAGRDLRIIGDGPKQTVLRGNPGAGTPLLTLAGPSRAKLEDLTIEGGSGLGVRITQADQPGGRVFVDQLTVSGEGTLHDDGVVVNGIERTDVTFEGLSSLFTRRGVIARGGLLAANEVAKGQVSVFGAAATAAQVLYDVESGGELLTVASWYEDPTSTASHIDLGPASTNDRPSSLVLADATIADSHDSTTPLARVAGHRGTFALLISNLLAVGDAEPQYLSIEGPGTDTRVLALGNGFDFSGTQASTASVWRDTTAPAASASFSSGVAVISDSVSDLSPETNKQTQVEPSAGDLRSGLELLRTARLEPVVARPTGITDVRIRRLWITARGVMTGLEVTGSP